MTTRARSDARQRAGAHATFAQGLERARTEAETGRDVSASRAGS